MVVNALHKACMMSHLMYCYLENDTVAGLMKLARESK